MALPNIFSKSITDDIILRIQQLNSNSKPKWGKMNVAQMLAHSNVTYELIYENKHPKPNSFVRFLLKLFVKNKVVSETKYQESLNTAPQFIIKEKKDFEVEKARLIAYLQKTQQLGEQEFDGKESHSFGTLTKDEWNNMLFKHIDHHLRQFGV